MYVHALYIHKTYQDSPNLESLKQYENTFLHMEPFLPLGVSLFPTTVDDDGMIQVDFYPLYIPFSCQLYRPLKRKSGKAVPVKEF